MGIAPGFEYDLFVSYAHADDTCADGTSGWVCQFVRHLDAALNQRLGSSGAPPRIFFDSRSTTANYQLSEFLAAVRKSALFLAVGSPNYAARDWPRQELAAFVERSPDPSRLFMIEFLPLAEGEFYPCPLDEHVPLEFWSRADSGNLAMPISPRDGQGFSTLVHRLASDMRERLLCMRHKGAAGSVAGAVPRPFRPVPVTLAANEPRQDTADARPTILVAQPTDDVADEADAVVCHLRQFADEVTVLPGAGYSQGGEAFMSAFRRDLGRSALFVQLLGRHAGRVPPDLPLGYTRFQLEAARAAGVEIMQWRHPDLHADTVSDADYRRLLTAETVVASGLEAFKSQVLNWARRRPRATHHAPARHESPTVFINADQNDLTVAREIERECLQRALTTFLPMCGPSSEASRKDLEENLIDCDVLLFIYGDTTQDWIRSQLRFFGKVKPKRETDPKLLAICSGPPVPKPDIGVSVPNAHIVNCPDGWDMSSVRHLLEELSP